jgi:transcriptional regulator with XRE-family HTH domain
MKTATFAARLLAAREKRGLTQAELGKLARLDDSAISHFEGGRRQPNMANLKALADALECTTDYLCGVD